MVRRLALVVGVLAAAVVASRCDTTDDFHCEEAVAHLAECCPNLDATRFNCTYRPPGCNFLGPPQCEDLDDLTPAEARCIVTADCGSLVETGACSRAVAAAGRGRTENGDAGCPDPRTSTVCP